MVKDTRFYDCLGVSPSASRQKIRSGFRKAALKWHPDKNKDKSVDAKAKFIEVYQAYEILQNEDTRRTYDEHGLQGVFSRGQSAAETEPDIERAHRPSPATGFPNYGGTSSADFRGFTNENNYEDDETAFDEDEMRRVLEELLRGRRQGDGSAPLFTAEDIEAMLRPSISQWAVASLFDIVINVSAGAAAAAAGAHANGSPVTRRVTSLGAIAGLTKAGIVSFAVLSKCWRLGPILPILFDLIGSGIVVCLLITVEISRMTIGQIPRALCIAALIAGIPLWSECSRGNSQWLVKCFLSCICCLPCFLIAWPLHPVPFDAFGGFIYALIAKSLGMPICVLHAAATAGAVYGTVIVAFNWVSTYLAVCCLFAAT